MRPRILGVLLLALVSCGPDQPAKPKEEFFTVSYTLSEGSKVIQSKSRKVTAADFKENETMVEFLSELQDVSGHFRMETIEPEGNLLVRTECDLVDGKIHGEYRNYGVLLGRETLTFAQSYQHGIKQGPCVAYGPKSVMYEGDYWEGQKSGVWRTFYRDGKPAFIGTLLEGRFEGKLEVNDINGKAVAVGFYKKGRAFNGTFLEDPWKVVSLDSYEDGEFKTELLQFKGGKELGREPLKVLTRLDR